MGLLLFFVIVATPVFTAVLWSIKPTRSASATELRLQSLLAPRKQTASQSMAEDLEKQAPTTFRWLEEPFANTSLAHVCNRVLLQSGSDATLGAFLFTSAVFAVVPPLLLFVITQNAVLSIAAIAFAFLPYAWLRRKRSKRITAFEKALPQSLEMFARSLRAGHSVPIAMSTLAEEAPEATRTEFAQAHRDQNYGLPLRDALTSMLDRTPSRYLRVFATGLLVQKDTGGNLPEIMDRIVAVLRDRVRVQGEVRTHTAQGRLTGWILCLLPVFLLLLINVLNPGYSRLLLVDPMGRKLLCAGAVLLMLGGLTIRQIIRGIEV